MKYLNYESMIDDLTTVNVKSYYQHSNHCLETYMIYY